MESLSRNITVFQLVDLIGDLINKKIRIFEENDMDKCIYESEIAQFIFKENNEFFEKKVIFYEIFNETIEIYVE